MNLITSEIDALKADAERYLTDLEAWVASVEARAKALSDRVSAALSGIVSVVPAAPVETPANPQ